MAAPVFPFERPLRDGRSVREIMCRACAGWTAWDGEVWRHVDGTEACVDPDVVWGRGRDPEPGLALIIATAVVRDAQEIADSETTNGGSGNG